MKFWRLLLKTGWVLYIVSFFIPVVKDGETLADGVLPGWQALSHALSGNEGNWGFASALTNILMLGTAGVLFVQTRLVVLGLTLLSIVSTLLNSYWFVAVEPRGDLFLGYYCWWLSYATVSTGLVLFSRSFFREDTNSLGESV